MGVHFLPGEGCALYRVLAETTSDIIIRTDSDGRIAESSLPVAGAARGELLWQIVEPGFSDVVERLHAVALAGDRTGAWTEVCGRPAKPRSRCAGRWYEMQVRGIADDDGLIHGAVTILRSIDDRRAYEDRLFVATMTDPLTGLTNRKAFVTMLGHLAQGGGHGCVAVFDVDHFRALNLRYGQADGDLVLVLMADLLRTLTRSEDIVSRIGGESFGLIMPGAPLEAARSVCEGIVGFLSDAAAACGPGDLPITASGGLAIIARSLDVSLRNVELALAIAKAKGRNRLEIGRDRDRVSLR